MIARLKGILDDMLEDRVIVDVGGVGYVAYCSARTMNRLPGIGEAVRLEIETHVREDHIHLYGFHDPAERDWFRLLTTVQGVGARVAMAILSTLSPDDLAQAIAAEDRAAITRANWVGPKVAGRIVSELKDKAATVSLAQTVGQPSVSTVPQQPDLMEDAVSALVNLGYSRTEAFGAVARAGGKLEDTPEVGALIKGGLAELSQ